MFASEEFKLTLFLTYTILFEAMVWGGFFYIVLIKGHSAWWVILAILLSGAQLKPYHFGLDYNLHNKKESTTDT